MWVTQKQLAIAINNMRERINESDKSIGILEEGNARHYECVVCGIIGHEPEVRNIGTWPYNSGWAHKSCLPGSKYDQRTISPGSTYERRKEQQDDSAS